MPNLPSLPALFAGKLYKTGQTRGADDDVIFQNRVGRNSTVLIPYDYWELASTPPAGEDRFENGFLALIPPSQYFDAPEVKNEMAARGLKLGVNALIFYETREDWRKHAPDKLGWVPATNRTDPLGGNYVARIAATTAADKDERTSRGFNTTARKGAGIRIYEYAGTTTISLCRLQLELLFWHCSDASEVASAQGMSAADITARRESNLRLCGQELLDDWDKLMSARLVNEQSRTICPLCLEEVSASGFFNKVEQAEGRLVPGNNVTQLNLFHVEELRPGSYGHRPYNLGWGHHHCNVVVKDAGINNTVIWMTEVVDRNIRAGYIKPGA